MSERIGYFDILRGLAILGVVAIHSSSTGLLFSENSINFDFTVLWRNLLNFSVPMFLAISGYFLAKKKFENYGNYFSYLKKQIPRVYIPLFFWSIISLSLAILIQNKSVIDELVKLVTFRSSIPYYFIALIIQFYILLPVLNRLANKRGLMLSIAISLIATSIIFYLRYFTDISLPVILYAGNFATWMMFFVLGLYIGTSGKIKISNKLIVIIIFVFYTLSSIETYLLIDMFHQAKNAVTAVKASSFMYSFALIIFLFNNRDWIKSKLLKKFGEMSFAIYLIHMLALGVASRLLSHFYPSLQEISYLYQLALVGTVMLICFLCVSAFNRVFSARLSRLIGFK